MCAEDDEALFELDFSALVGWPCSEPSSANKVIAKKLICYEYGGRSFAEGGRTGLE